MSDAIVPTDGAPIGNTHTIAFGSILVYIIGILLPVLAGRVFHNAQDIVTACQSIGIMLQSVAFGGAIASRPPWIKQ